MRLDAPTDFGKITTLEQIIRWTSKFAGQLGDLANGNIEFDTNIRSQTIDFRFDAAQTERAIGHNLKRIPQGYITVKIDSSAILWTTGTTWTINTIYLQASTTVTARLIIF